jgi:hypothetical protein
MTSKQKIALISAAPLLVAIIAILLTSSTGQTNPPRHAAQAQAHAQKASCDAGLADDTIPASPPTDLKWRNIGALLVPISATYGPTKYNGQLWTCYRHDPMGAVLAAYEILAATITPDWRQVAEEQIVPGSAQQAYIQAGETETLPTLSPGEVVQPVGFEVVSYTPQEAIIMTLGTSGSSSYYQTDQRTLAWSGGDWKLQLEPDGRIGPDPQQISSANGFVLWGDNNG